LLVEKAKKVICIELDKKMIKILNDRFIAYNNIELINEDVLKINLNKLIEQEKENNKIKNVKIVANLPYYITTPIIMKLIEDKIMPDKIAVMVQKEVGDRFKAVPGTKDYSSLSIFLNYYYEVSKLMDVSRNVFLPKPNVDSIVVQFKKRDNKINLKNEDIFFKLVKDSFVQKRKTLRNNLKNYNLKKIEEVLNRHGYDLSVRAEHLSIDIFAEISNEL
ncbi:MAG: 16S rRNA (adenine(1518)-N(6)/adenine(1519)-N(6))-dimethyltransferase RsmA, partial [Bacilli bacterium]|nr:16S rRNA (adenine(1518)-N(6)/adenine(1519)-N(6))-dimethyltransferase RsmA [Bacilli bacterium]